MFLFHDGVCVVQDTLFPIHPDSLCWTYTKTVLCHRNILMSHCYILKPTALSRMNKIINTNCCCLVDFKHPQCSLLRVLLISCLGALFCILQEAIEKKEQRAKRFHFRAEVNLAQRNVALDRDVMKKGTSSSSSQEKKIPLVTSSQCLDLIYPAIFSAFLEVLPD